MLKVRSRPALNTLCGFVILTPLPVLAIKKAATLADDGPCG